MAEIKALFFQEADAIREEDIQISRGIGGIGFGLEELKQEGEGDWHHDPLQCRHAGHCKVRHCHGAHVHCP